MKRIYQRKLCLVLPPVLAVFLASANSAPAQEGRLFRYEGDMIPAHVERMYTAGLAFLVKTQTESGGWSDTYGQQPGVAGLAVVAMLAHGDDPETCPCATAIRRALKFICDAQDKSTGYIGNSMYNHGFATLALAEVYGAVDNPQIGPALEKAVKLILSAQKNNSMGGWRYSPESTDADTTVSGAQLVALLAARNAGIDVPDAAIKTAVDFYRGLQSGDGGFGYASPGSPTPSQCAIGTLVFALAKRKDSPEFKAGLRNLVRIGNFDGGRPFYFHYYAAQALFHGDMAEWRKWTGENEKWLMSTQAGDGSWADQMGQVFATSSALLSLALHYRYLPIYER